jgi:hypothetical protein
MKSTLGQLSKKRRNMMDAAMSNKVNDKILTTLDHCISKMADVLNKTFDFNNYSSMSLFKSFCSSVTTHATFMKSIEKQIDKTIENIERASKILNSQPNAKPNIKSDTKPFDLSFVSFTPPKKTCKEYQHPVCPQDLQSGLVIKK